MAGVGTEAERAAVDGRFDAAHRALIADKSVQFDFAPVIQPKPPKLPESMARPLRWLANASHALFYALLLVMPLSGWWTSSAVPDPKRHAFGFGLFDIPFLPVAQSWPAAGAARFVHTNLVWVMVALVVLHIGAALKHHFVDKDDVLKRMLPRRT